MSKVKVGVLGAGRGMNFVKQFHELPESEMVALCDAHPVRLERALESAGIEGLQGFDNYQEMLKQDLDIVVVATGAPDHGEHSCLALEAGKHVLSEVPAEVSLEACRKIVETVRRTGLKYMMGANTYFWGYLQEWKRLVAEGRLGEVHYAEGEYIHDVRGMFIKDPKTGYGIHPRDLSKFPDAVKTWRGTLHPINYLTHDLGPLLEIMEDRCVSVNCLATEPIVGPDFAPGAEVAIFRTAKNRVIKILCAFSFVHPGHHFSMLMGTKGSIESPRGAAQDHVLFVEGENMSGWSRMSWDTKLLSGPAAAFASGHGGADWHVSRSFLDAILEDKDPPVDVYRSMDYTVPGICAVQSGQQGGQTVEIPDLREE